MLDLEQISRLLGETWAWILTLLNAVTAIACLTHLVLTKRNSRSAVGWAGLVLLVPLAGALLYWVLGINRIHRQAVQLRPGTLPYPEGRGPDAALQVSAQTVESSAGIGSLAPLVRLLDRVVREPLLRGNVVEPLFCGEQAYPAMLRAIDHARETVHLSTYIFDNDPVGRDFADRLGAASARGVEVRVLIDDVGLRYSFPPILGRLKRRGIRVARFLPSRMPWRARTVNLRNHRKLLVVDGRVGFTGGMNLRQAHNVESAGAKATRDLHFRIEGPVVAHLQHAFASDWRFTTSERLMLPHYYPPLQDVGPALARGIPDGPDEDFEKFQWCLLGALACAQRSVRIMTPYFLPEAELTSALNVAAMRGVDVQVLLPLESNLPLVQWAMHGQLVDVLDKGCRVFLSPPPFDHSKLMIVDEQWLLFGSGNWDPRSLRLNFEYNVECYDAELAGRLTAFFDNLVLASTEYTLEDWHHRPVWIRLRDGLARLFSPYL